MTDLSSQTDSETPATAEGDSISLRTQCAVYGVGMFSTTLYFTMLVAVPLWIQNMDLTPFMLGIALGCRPVLALFISIPAGNLMDRIGARRVVFFTAALGVVTPIFYPMLPNVWPLIVLQLLSGVADSVGWLGAQTLVGTVLEGRTTYAGRLSAIIRIGHIVGPPITGAAWDLWGPWAAFGTITLCGVGALISALMLPKGGGRTGGSGGAHDATPPGRITPGDLMPRWSEYAAAFRMMATPAIAITVMIGMMVHVGNNVQSTFYVVWLNEVANIPGTLIGTLISISSAGAIVGSLLAAPLRRRFRPYWMLWFVILMATILISITPLLGTFIVFAVVLSLRTVFTGIHQPLVVTLMLRTVGPNDKGKAIGLRSTANRISAIAAPFLFGSIAQLITDVTGDRVLALELSFYIIGGIACILMMAIAWRLIGYPQIHDLAERGRAASPTE